MVDLVKLKPHRMTFLKQNIECPLGNAGGTCKTREHLAKLLLTGLYAIEIGSITVEKRDGNTGNTFHKGEHITLNSLGLPNPGREYYEDNLKGMTSLIRKAGKKSIVNVVGFTEDEYTSLTRLSFKSGADMVVLNYGCPNVWVGGVTQKSILTYNLDALKTTTQRVMLENITEASDGRIGVKLSPIFDPTYLHAVGDFFNSLIRAPYQGKIGFITTMNTVPNCYDSHENGERVISPAGGLSGMAGSGIFPMALGQVKQFREILLPEIDIIGVGGVDSGLAMKKMLRAGASFVQVASAYYHNENPGVFNEIGAGYMMME